MPELINYLKLCIASIESEPPDNHILNQQSTNTGRIIVLTVGSFKQRTAHKLRVELYTGTQIRIITVSNIRHNNSLVSLQNMYGSLQKSAEYHVISKPLDIQKQERFSQHVSAIYSAVFVNLRIDRY